MSASPAPTEPTSRPGAEAGESSRWYTLALLVLALVVCSIDRNIISVLLEPIRQEFHLRDWQLGLLAGLTFTLLYSLGSLVVARWAERRNRVTILASALALWSMLTVVCGLAGSFLQLLAARAGVGLAESGSQVPSHSLIADLFRGRDRSLAMGIYAAGALVGVTLALPIGALALQVFGWRGALWMVGAPGVLLALLLTLTVRDPRFATAAAKAATEARIDADQESFLQAARIIFASPSMRNLILAATLSTMAGAVFLSFGVSVLVRVHDMSPAQAGLVLGLVYAPASLIGTVASGWAVSRLIARDHRWRAWLPMWTQMLTPVFKTGFLLIASTPLALASVAVASMLSSSWLGPTFAAMQDCAGAKRRATAAACMMVCLNLFGFGLAPLIAGIVSDVLSARFGERSIAIGILILQPLALLASYHFWRASRHLRAQPAD